MQLPHVIIAGHGCRLRWPRAVARPLAARDAGLAARARLRAHQVQASAAAYCSRGCTGQGCVRERAGSCWGGWGQAAAAARAVATTTQRPAGTRIEQQQ